MSKSTKNNSQETTVEKYSPPQIDDTVLTQEYGAKPKTKKSGLRRTDTQAIDPYGSRPSNTILSPSTAIAESKSNER